VGTADGIESYSYAFGNDDEGDDRQTDQRTDQQGEHQENLILALPQKGNPAGRTYLPPR
jgi:hypothetical protein